ncbi:MAG: BON domain-containing protein [Nitrospirae bacterium]|nr:BON domain-containing protein [Candidatus Manganitrophaceae bacterium]
MRTFYPRLLMAAAIALFVTSAPLHASDTDDRIETAAKKSYVFKTYLKDDSIHVNSKDGVVTLTGTVDQESHQTLAQETVAGLPGVKRVDNQLKVKGERPAKDSDGWLATKVKSALLFHKNVSAVKTEVDAKNGLVTLRGEAESEAQKDLTAEYTKEVEGVKGVKNLMTVAKSGAKRDEPRRDESVGQNIDDASITAQVKMALLSHRSTSAGDTKVETNDGVVTLSGRARNTAEKDLTTKLVDDINGVKKVVNNMTVDEKISKRN